MNLGKESSTAKSGVVTYCNDQRLQILSEEDMLLIIQAADLLIKNEDKPAVLCANISEYFRRRTLINFMLAMQQGIKIFSILSFSYKAKV